MLKYHCIATLWKLTGACQLVIVLFMLDIASVQRNDVIGQLKTVMWFQDKILSLKMLQSCNAWQRMCAS